MMDDDDFDLPMLPDALQTTPPVGSTLSIEDAPIPAHELLDDSYALNTKKEDIQEFIEGEYNQKVFIREMAVCDLYQHNINKCFKYATSINAVLRLVNGGLTVMRHRRAVIQHVSAMQKKPEPEDTLIEYDLMGRIIPKGRR